LLQAGSWLADRWQLPRLLVEAIAGHHSSVEGAIPRMIGVAEQAALNAELGLGGELEAPADGEADVEAYLRSRGDEIDAFFRIASKAA